MSPERDGGFINSLRRVAVCGAAGVGAVVLAFNADDILPGMPGFDIPEFNINIGNNSPEAEAKVKPDTYSVEEHDLGIACEARLSAGVGTKGNKDELIGGGRFNDVVFADALYCGNDPFQGEHNVDGNIQLTKNDSSGRVTNVLIRSAGLQSQHPRINFFDFRQCVKLDADDSAEKIEEKTEQWIEETKERIADGKDPKCDIGFDVTGVGGWPDLANVIPASYAASQLAMAVDQAPQTILKDMNDEFFAELMKEATDRYPGAEIVIEKLDIADASEKRLEEIKAELKKNYFKVEEKREDGKIELYVTGPGSVRVRVPEISFVRSQPVRITGMSAVDVIPEASKPRTPR